MVAFQKLKSLLRDSCPFYNSVQKLYYSFRYILDRYIFGTKLNEFNWKCRHIFNKRWGEQYLESVIQPHRKLLIERISDNAPFGSVLEIGCASAPNLFMLAQKFPGIKLEGVDISCHAVKTGNDFFHKKGIKNVFLSYGKADDLFFIKDKSFDIVFSVAVLIYIGPDKIKKVASEMLRIAKKAVVLLEYHLESEGASGIYTQGTWLRNYKDLFQQYSKQIKLTKILPEVWEGNWAKFGYIIEIKL